MKRILLFIAVSISLLGCEGNGVESIDPGTIEIRLKIINRGFINSDRFDLTVQSLKIERNDNAYADIFDNIHSLRDNPDSYNIFSDSLFVIGESYIPEGNFKKLLIMFSPPDSMTYNNRMISVTKPPSFDGLYELDYDIQTAANRRIIVTVACKIDSILTKKIDHFEYSHNFFIDRIELN